MAIFFTVNYATTYAQQSFMQIAGAVVDTRTKKPLAGASIYLDHTTLGTTSAEDGAFVLNDIPSGNYHLIVSYIGYNPVSVSVTAAYHPRFKIELYPLSEQLSEVVVTGDAHWKAYFSLFKIFYIGRDENARECTIENPEALSFQYNDSTYTLIGETDKPLIIDNRALGYKISVDLNYFAHYANAGRTSYAGYTHFQEMTPADGNEQAKWESNRKKAYYGSLTHFMRSLVNNRVKKEGFVVKKLVKAKSNPSHHYVLQRWQGDEFKSSDTIVTMRWNGRDYSPEDTALTRFDIFPMNDSDRTIPANSYQWGRKMGYNVLYPGEISRDSIVNATADEGNEKLSFRNSLFITYKNRKIYQDFWGYGNAFRPSFETSILTMVVPGTFVDRHGNLADPLAVISEGYWSTLRVADQLPFDYNPETDNDQAPAPKAH